MTQKADSAPRRRYAVWNRWTWQNIGEAVGTPIGTFDSVISAGARAGMEMQRNPAAYVVVDRRCGLVLATVQTSGETRLS